MRAGGEIKDEGGGARTTTAAQGAKMRREGVGGGGGSPAGHQRAHARMRAMRGPAPNSLLHLFHPSSPCNLWGVKSKLTFRGGQT